jgi:hypothetical protein
LRLGGEGEGRIAVDGSMAVIPVLVWGLEGSGVEARAWLAWSICTWLGGVNGVGGS